MVSRVRIPLVGGNYKHDSIPFDRQETINMFPERGGRQSKSGGILRRTPGLKPWINVFTPGLIRGMYVSSNDILYVCRGRLLVKVLSDKSQTPIATLTSGNDRISMVDNGSQLCIADGAGMWLYNGVFQTAITSNAPVKTPVLVFIDGYIFGFDPDEALIGRFQHSNLNDCTIWNALDTYTSEGSPDRTVTLAALNRQLWVFGSKSFEVWYNRGGNNTTTGATWARIDGTFTEIGCASKDSVSTISGKMFWLGSSKEGENVIWGSGEGYQPMKVSDKPTETAISNMATVSDAWGSTFLYEGHYFYCISFPSENKTFLYDITEGQWVTWASRDTVTGTQDRIRILTSAYFDRKNLVGDYENGNVYELDKETYTDNGNPIVLERYFAYFQANNLRVTIYSLFIDILTGSGLLTGQGSDPKIQIRWLVEGSEIYGNWHEMSVGLRGKYSTQVVKRMLGNRRVWGFHIRSSEPIPMSVQDNCWAEIEVSDS